MLIPRFTQPTSTPHCPPIENDPLKDHSFSALNVAYKNKSNLESTHLSGLYAHTPLDEGLSYLSLP